MKSVKFKLLFDGDENDLVQRSFEVAGNKQSLSFQTAQLRDINELQSAIGVAQIDEIQTYFAYTGFSLYYLESNGTIYLFLYRQYQQKHQLYERGYFIR
jgi:hypothetical protein